MKPTIFLAVISLLLTCCAVDNVIGKTVKAEGADITTSIQAQNITEIEANQAIGGKLHCWYTGVR